MSDPRILISGIKPLLLQDGVNPAESWRKWLQKFEIYSDANELHILQEEKQVAIFLNSLGDDGIEIFNSFNINRKSAKLRDVIQKFEGKFNPCKNITVERYNFFTRFQQNYETLDEYVTVLNNLSTSCEFNKLKEDLIKDMFVIGINNQQIKEKLLQEENLTLENAIKLAKNIELSQDRSNKLQHNTVAQYSQNSQDSVKIIQRRLQERSFSKGRQHRVPEYAAHRSRSSSKTRRTKQPSRDLSSPVLTSKICQRCGQVHKFKCPAQGITCHKCGKRNHFANQCLSKSHKYKNSVSIINSKEKSNITKYVINTINKNTLNEWQIQILCNKFKLICQIDTGADTNVISKQTLDKIMSFSKKKIPIFRFNNIIYTFSGEIIPNLGSCKLNCKFDNGIISNIYFVVVNYDCQTIIGWRTSEKLGIVKRIFKINKTNPQGDFNISQRSVKNLVEKYQNTFEGLGCLPYKAHLDIDMNIKPKVCPVRRIPYSLQNKLKGELDEMIRLKVIEKVNKPTPWVNSIVLVEKPNGKLRICLDPRNLNQAIKRPYYPYPTFDDLRSKVAGAQIFSKLDASSSYWTICLDSESSDLCTFNTPFGRYKFLRLPYGINSSGEIFHRTMNEFFSDLPGVIIFVDDILVYGSNQTEHNARLESVFKRATEVNLKFNKSKCQFGLSEICYVGHIFNKNGISADKSKVEAIIKMPTPTNVKELQRFMGMINYLGSYIPNLAQETSILRDLLKKQNIWQWLDQHEKQFSRLKSLISQSPVLVHYDIKKPIRMSVDSSKDAIGAVILHGKNPIAYASKSLTKCQENYAQIEKELYAIVFGCKKFHQYIYGIPIQVETDHQPLVTLFKKPLSDVPTRLQRMMIVLQAYHLIVSYTKGSEMYISDTLSRAPVKQSSPSNSELINFDEIDKNIEIHVNLVTSNLAISPEKLDKILLQTEQDLTLRKLKEYHKNGWPSCKQHCDNLVLPYWNIRDEIHVINNLLFKNNSVIIPWSMRSEILNILHEGHQGIEKTKSLARSTVYWPNINQEIENKIKQCESCNIFSSNKSKEKMLSHEIPTFPWQKLATDLFEYKGKKYLIVVDFYSNYIEIANLNKNTKTWSVINELKAIFARHGIPMKLHSDGGPPFNSYEFKKFLKEWDIEQIVSSPHLPRSNGLAEISVKIVKNIFKKCDQSGTDPLIGLLHYRNTPRGKLESPAKLLMSRQLRTKLPDKISNLKPKITSHLQYVQNKTKNQMKSQSYYNRNCKQYQKFQVNQEVYFKKNPNDIIWTKGTIVSKTKYPRSFIVKDKFNVTYRRNTQHMRHNYKSQHSNFQSSQRNRHVQFDNLSHKDNSFKYSQYQTEPVYCHKAKREDNDCENYLMYTFSQSQTNQSKPSQSVNQSENESSNVIGENQSDSNDSFISTQEMSDLNKSPIFVNVNESDSFNDSKQNVINEFNEYKSENLLSLSDQPSSHNESPKFVIVSPPTKLTENEESQVNTQAEQYSRKGRLLKKTQKLDL